MQPSDKCSTILRDCFRTRAEVFRLLAGALMGADYHYDLTRVGIALYGGSPFDTDDHRLAPVAALKAPVVQLRHARPGETVGYGATHKVETPSLLATIALGYGDGFPRTASSRAFAFVNGALAPIVGRISMDLITLDITKTRGACKNRRYRGDIWAESPHS